MKTKLIAFITFVIMIGVNISANLLPINGITTGQLSDLYPNLFTPIGSTFSIWGLIYISLLVYCIYQFRPMSSAKEKQIYNINKFFIVSSLLKSAWVFSWHYKLVGLSVLLMLGLLLSLIKISNLIKSAPFSHMERLFIKLPFGIYFGWITVATIANITVLLVSLGWKDFILPDQIWTSVILVVGTIIASITTIKQKNLAYGIVPIWAYYGIYLKHTSPFYFNSSYPDIINTTLSCILILAIVNLYLIKKKEFI